MDDAKEEALLYPLQAPTMSNLVTWRDGRNTRYYEVFIKPWLSNGSSQKAMTSPTSSIFPHGDTFSPLLHRFLHVAAHPGALVVMERIDGPTTGLVLDSIRQEIHLIQSSYKSCCWSSGNGTTSENPPTKNRS